MTEEAREELIANTAKQFRDKAEKSNDWDRYEKYCQVWLRGFLAAAGLDKER